MQKTRRTWAIGVVATLAVIGAACSSDKTTTATSNSSSAGSGSSAAGLDIDYSKLTGTLNGSGSSFQDSFNQKAKSEFAKKASGVTVNYTKSGSSAGKQDLANQVVQFAGTDSLIKDADKATFKGGDVLYFPTVGAPITVSYNANGVDKLQLSPETLAGIFQATITKWNDAKIAADNPGVTLPSTTIAVVHRLDGSGTTSNFTKYLKAAAPTVWTLDSGDTVNWPASTQGAEKNSGVASLVKTTDGAIGYVDLADAVNASLKTASIKNKAGTFVSPTLDGASAALAGADVKADLTYDPLDAAGETAYPITSPTWIIVYKKQTDAAVAEALKGWLNFILTDGQGFAKTVGYAQLPSALAQKAIDQLSQITN
ncbi:MAG: phosphate transport system substrate-binding protein [Acidimicrobiaceae bacterium]|jgi:phosphate transport system substrate-binding protein